MVGLKGQEKPSGKNKEREKMGGKWGEDGGNMGELGGNWVGGWGGGGGENHREAEVSSLRV